MHPGFILGQELEKREIKQKDFAEEIGIAQSQLNEIIKGKRGINPSLAMLLGATLDIDARKWLDLQMDYDLKIAEADEENRSRKKALERWKFIKNYVPIKFFKNENLINGNEPMNDEKILLEVYGANSWNDFQKLVEEPIDGKFKKSDKLKINPVNMTGWVKLVQFKARQEVMATFFIPDNLTAIIDNLKKAFLSNSVIKNTQNILTQFGIKFIYQPKFEQTPIDGISFWSEGNPAIGVTARLNKIDNFAFTVLHELGHIVLHINSDREKLFIDIDKELSLSEKDKEEKQANEFAANNLIPKKDYNEFVSKNQFDDESIINFALSLNIHPAIVRGRLQFEHIIDWNTFTIIENKIKM